MRSELRALTRTLIAADPDRSSRLAGCGLPHSGQVVVTPSGVWGLASCGLGLRCGWCNSKALETARKKLDFFVTENEARNGWGIHQVLTVRHRRHDPLEGLLDDVQYGWSLIGNDYTVRKLRREYAMAPLQMLDVTWSPRHGWHPHYHVLWVGVGDRSEAAHRIDAAVGDAWASTPGGSSEQAVWTAEHYDPPHWVKYVSTKSKYHPNNDCRHPEHPGCRFCKNDPADDEFWRQLGDGADDDVWRQLETDDWDTHLPKRDDTWRIPGMEVFGQISAAAVAGSPQARALLAEYVSATAGHRLMGSTRGAANLLGSPPDDDERPSRVVDGVKVSSRLWGLVHLGRGSDSRAFKAAALEGDLVGMSLAVGCRVVESNGEYTTPEIADPNHDRYTCNHGAGQIAPPNRSNQK